MNTFDTIYTSYFGKIRRILRVYPDAYLVSIAGKTPECFSGIKYMQLMPKYVWWKEWHDKFSNDLESNESKEWYEDRYYSTVLNNLNAQCIVEDLHKISNDKHPIFLLCYEIPEKFCHRHIVANWLKNNGFNCEEWCNEN